MTMLERVAEKQRALNRQSEELRPIIERVVTRSFIALAKKYPQIYSVGWVQFTPRDSSDSYRVFEIQYFKITLQGGKRFTCVGLEDTDITGQEEYLKHYGFAMSHLAREYPEIHEEFTAMQEPVRTLTPALQYIFGDDKEIYVTREGLESWKHDFVDNFS